MIKKLKIVSKKTASEKHGPKVIASEILEYMMESHNRWRWTEHVEPIAFGNLAVGISAIWEIPEKKVYRILTSMTGFMKVNGGILNQKSEQKALKLIEGILTKD